MSKTIFIAIAAFNEPELKLTIDNALAMADNPQNIYFGIAAHYRDLKAPDFSGYKNVKITYLSHPEMLGIGIGRSIANNFYEKQDYFMQIDGHTLFQKSWDSIVTIKYKKLLSFYNKPLISNYVPWWSVNEDETINMYDPDLKIHNSVIKYKDIDNPEIKKHDYPLQDGYAIDWNNHPEGHKKHGNLAGHFVFTLPSFIDDVAPDPQIFYSGEEPLLALRSWTRGYTLVAIPEPIVWHKNKGHGYIHPNDRWKHPDTEGFRDWFIAKDQVSAKRTFEFLTGKQFGYWGALSKEQLLNYQKFVNIDFKEYYKNLRFAERE